ncbi:MAG: GspE/PulE family protein [Granulosicoccaceae bacterium]|jgi:type II secretory ATPase GspE/PulE/Tfp pilus assembly ATPase PilB-like protein
MDGATPTNNKVQSLEAGGDNAAAAGGKGNERVEHLRQSLQFQTRLNQLIQEIHESESFAGIMPQIEPVLLELLNAERITVYRRNRHSQEIISEYKSGEESLEIRVPLSNTSIAGYVALTQKPLRISDVYDMAELRTIHADLQFDSSFDKQTGFRSRSMMVIPIKHKKVMLGVMQVLNRRGGGEFNDAEMAKAMKFAMLLGQKFRYELGGANRPYEYLVQTGRITQRELDEFEKRAPAENTTVTRLLLNEANLTAFEVGTSLERYYQVPYTPYDPEVDIPLEIVKNVNEAYLRKQLWVPIAANDDEVVILIDDPTDNHRIMEIQNIVRAHNFSFKLGLPEDILRYLGQDAGAGSHLDLHELVGRLQDERLEEEELDVADTVDENEATVIQLVNSLILDAYRAGASDIHIEPSKGKTASKVRLRVDGICRNALTIPASHIRAVVSRIKVMARLDISERRKPQDGKLAVKYKGQPIELRVATLPTVNGESVVMRILAASEPLPLGKLNLSDRNLEEIKRLTASPHGIFLVVGPTGSGKTTTLHAVLGHINTPERKIWTAEDPVEITQPGLQQMQVLPKIGLTFAAALRSFLRADPDVIMIGEMRDQETAESGVEASLTGHLVFSTLHTNSAPETLTRLLDMGIDPVSFSDALLGVLAQRLVRTLCSDCKQTYTPEAEEFQLLQRYYGEEVFGELNVDRANLKLYRAVGCDRCGGTGYRGRTGVHELLVSTHEMKELIYRRATASEIKELAVQQGMRTLMQDGIVKLLKGQTDLAQVRRVAAE